MGKNHISNNCVFHLFLAYGQNLKTCYDEPSLNSFPLNFNIPTTEESREANNAVTHVRIAYRLFVPWFVVLFLIFVCVGHCLTNFSRERVLGRYSGKILSLILQEGVFILFYFIFLRVNSGRISQKVQNETRSAVSKDGFFPNPLSINVITKSACPRDLIRR